jgi:hypothetical protein
MSVYIVLEITFKAKEYKFKIRNKGSGARLFLVYRRHKKNALQSFYGAIFL